MDLLPFKPQPNPHQQFKMTFCVITTRLWYQQGPPDEEVYVDLTLNRLRAVTESETGCFYIYAALRRFCADRRREKTLGHVLLIHTRKIIVLKNKLLYSAPQDAINSINTTMMLKKSH